MKQKAILILLLVIMLSACSGGQKSTGSPVVITPTGSQSGYPAAGYPGPGDNAYPSPIQSNASNPTAGPIAIKPTDVPNPENTPLIIASVTHTQDGMEKIVVRNISNKEIDMTGIVLYNPLTEEKQYLSADKTLGAGKDIIIYNGPLPIDPGAGIKWTNKRMLNSNGDEVVLINAASRLLWDYVYYGQ